MKKNLYFLSILSLIFGMACDKANPVAPSGTVLTMTANPTRISTNGESTIFLKALRPDGQPVFEGTEFNLNTNLGTLPTVLQADVNGEASATLKANGVSGTATVTARVGSSEAQTIDITVGIQAAIVRLQASPSTLREDGGAVELTAILWDEQGDFLGNADVVFSADVGILDSGNGIVQTDSGGTAEDRLVVRGRDVNVLSGDSFEVRAESANAGSLISDSVTISISRPPRAGFNFNVEGLTATFTDTSTGDPTSFLWNFGDGSTSEVRNPSHIYQVAGTFVVTLEARNAAGSDSISRSITVIGGN